MKLVFRRATRDDLHALLAIEQASFAQPHWKADDFLEDECIVAERDRQIAGFIVYREIAGSEREILNLAVDPSRRRSGIASALLRHTLRGPAVSFLEVRESNIGARNLYRKFGFVEVGRRPEYYESPVEAAIVMKKK